MTNNKADKLELIFSGLTLNEAIINSYEIEFDLIGKRIKQKSFFNQKETCIPKEKIITVIFDNEILPNANMVSIALVGNQVKYQLSIYLSFDKWNELIILNNFITKLNAHCATQGFEIELEDHDLQGCYLLATSKNAPTGKLFQRIDNLSQVIAKFLKKS